MRIDAIQKLSFYEEKHPLFGIFLFFEDVIAKVLIFVSAPELSDQPPKNSVDYQFTELGSPKSFR